MIDCRLHMQHTVIRGPQSQQEPPKRPGSCQCGMLLLLLLLQVPLQVAGALSSAKSGQKSQSSLALRAVDVDEVLLVGTLVCATLVVVRVAGLFTA